MVASMLAVASAGAAELAATHSERAMLLKSRALAAHVLCACVPQSSSLEPERARGPPNGWPKRVGVAREPREGVRAKPSLKEPGCVYRLCDPQ